MQGKNYAQRDEVLKNDLYHTPESLTMLLLKEERFKRVEEPACGELSIVNPLQDEGYDVVYTDLVHGDDFLKNEAPKKRNDCITNPPFFLWDDFVKKSKELGYRKTAFIGRGNYFGTVDRYSQGIFDSLKKVYFFNRYVDYRTPRRKDGLFHVGAMLTGWFIWERGYKGKPEINYLDVQPWAKLGGYNESNYQILQHLGIESTWTPDMEINVKLLTEQLQDELKFIFTLKEEEKIKRANDITTLVKVTHKAGFDRQLLNLKKWERV